jgi:hypothetical protein
VGTIRDAIGCAQDGDTIRIDLNAGDTIELMSQLVIDKDLVVINEGNGYAPVYAAGSGVGIVIAEGALVHLHDLLLGGQGTTVLENEGVLHLHGCKIDGENVSGVPVMNRNEGRIHGVVVVE